MGAKIFYEKLRELSWQALQAQAVVELPLKRTMVKFARCPYRSALLAYSRCCCCCKEGRVVAALLTFYLSIV